MNSKDCKIFIAGFVESHPEFLDFQAKCNQLIAFDAAISNHKHYPTKGEKTPTFLDQKNAYDKVIIFGAKSSCWKRIYKKSGSSFYSGRKLMLYPNVILDMDEVIKTRVFVLKDSYGGIFYPNTFITVFETKEGLFLSEDIENYPDLLHRCEREAKLLQYGVEDFDIESSLKKWKQDLPTLKERLKSMGII